MAVSETENVVDGSMNVAGETMEAVVIREYGDASVLEYVDDAPVPQPAKNQVLIKVYGTSVNPIDWKIRNGALKLFLGKNFPIVLGHDVAGEIVCCGEDVEHFKPGDRVFAMLDANATPSKTGFAKSGAYAQFAVSREDTLALIPNGLSYVEAASIPLAGLTAYQSLVHKAGIKHGDNVLINGASGGVGMFAVQISKSFGAKVTAVCSRKNLDFVAGLGADLVLDYQTQQIQALRQRYDIIFDVVSNQSFDSCNQLLLQDGIIITCTPSVEVILSNLKTTFRRIMGSRKKHDYSWVRPSGDDLEKLSKLVRSKKVHTFIGKEFVLEQVEQAHELSEAGHCAGKIVLSVPQTLSVPQK